MSVVINSTNQNRGSFCIYCKTTDSDTEFHDIFDEIGLELQLPSLVRQFFGINVKSNRNKQLLCQECVNRLIELFDLEEHCNGAKAIDDNVQDQGESSNKNSSHIDNVELSANYEYLIENAEEILNVGEGTEEILNVVARTEEILNVDDESVATLTNHVDEVEDEEEMVYEQEIASESVLNYGESEFADDNHIDDEDVGIIPDDQIDYESEYTGNVSTGELTNLSLHKIEEEQQIPDEELLQLECVSPKIENDVYEEVITMEFQELDNEYLHMESVKCLEDANEMYNETTEESLTNTVSIETEDNSMDVMEQGSLHGDQDEEYLIEETICFEEYDNVDLNEYLDNALVTNFEDLQLKWVVECKLCLYKQYSFQELIKHPCINEQIDEQQLPCIINDCDDIFTNLNSLARHLIIKHYNNVESVAIYGRCPDCQKPFSNITDFNKHSCCNIKRKAGARNYCQACSLDFQSLKRYVFHMQFHLTKHRPKLCVLCGAMFNNADDFFDHVSYSHEPDTAMACIKCDRFFQNKSVFEQHMIRHDSKYAFECRHCPKKYTNRSGLTGHMDVYHNHEMKALQCEYCYKEFVNQSSYRSHIKAHMPEAKVPAYICSICGLVSNSTDIIQSHLETDEASLGLTGEIIEKILTVAFTCECCSIDFFSARYLQHHRLSPRHNEKLFHCPICRKAFKTLKHMRNHMTSHKDYDEWLNAFPIARLYMCNVGDCQDAYPLWSSLYYHKKRHKNTEASGDPFNCQFCEKVCGTKMSLAIHVARMHNNNNRKCPHCHKSYKYEKDLNRHVEHIHVSVQCSKCRKNFKNRRNLISHEQLVHKNAKRYFCSHCNKGYYYKSEMQAHEKNVHPETSYKCKLCNFVTNYPKSLDIHHVAKHTEDLPFKCPSCSKGFARKQLLVLHMKRHKADKDFICYEYCDDGCNSSFISHFLLRKHIESKHPSKDNETGQNTKTKRRKTKEHNDNQLLIVEDDTGDVELVLDENGEMGSDDEEYELHYEHEGDDGEDDEIVDEIADEGEYVYADMET